MACACDYVTKIHAQRWFYLQKLTLNTHFPHATLMNFHHRDTFILLGKEYCCRPPQQDSPPLRKTPPDTPCTYDCDGERIARAVRKNGVVILRVSTGSGKSTQVPQFLLEDKEEEEEEEDDDPINGGGGNDDPRHPPDGILEQRWRRQRKRQQRTGGNGRRNGNATASAMDGATAMHRQRDGDNNAMALTGGGAKEQRQWRRYRTTAVAAEAWGWKLGGNAVATAVVAAAPAAWRR